MAGLGSFFRRLARNLPQIIVGARGDEVTSDENEDASDEKPDAEPCESAPE